MATRTLMTGSRIRARRLDQGLSQSDLARAMGISPSYLNLIEHDRRPIAGKLLSAAARVLGTETTALARGAEAALVDGLRDAAALVPGRSSDQSVNPDPEPDPETAEEFARRFPDWAALTVTQARRIGDLRRTVETLSDRMTHDPFLSTALHDVLSTVTAIRASSAILANDDDIAHEWQTRFHRNMFEDSQRLAESAQELVAYLNSAGQADATLSTPQEEFDAWLAGHGFHLPTLENTATDPASVVPMGATPGARAMIEAYARQYSIDATRLPLDRLRAAIADCIDPALLARQFDTDLHHVFRRIAALPEGIAGRPVGLVVCDGSGTLTFRKPVEGFALPRFGAACPLWPLYEALCRPHSQIFTHVEQISQLHPRFAIYAQAVLTHVGDFDDPPVATAAMLILPQAGDGPARPVGTSCRICPRPRCPARREPAIVADLA